MSNPHQSLSLDELPVLAQALGDSPHTVIAVHLLERSLCRAYVVGTAARFGAAVIQAMHDREEPFAFGSDVAALWLLLAGVKGWRCVNTPEHIAPALGALITDATGDSVRFDGDLYYTLATPVRMRTDDHVRPFTMEDLPLWQHSPPPFQFKGFGDLRALLSDGVAAGAIVHGELVAVAATSALTSGHGDIAVVTLEGFRGRGLATAAASLAVHAVQQRGATPVWSTGEGNLASQRVAEKLGFTPAGRRTYVIPGG